LSLTIGIEFLFEGTELRLRIIGKKPGFTDSFPRFGATLAKKVTPNARAEIRDPQP
jgi:hypothetical protein